MISNDPQSSIFLDERRATVFPLALIRGFVNLYFDPPGAKKSSAILPERLRADSALSQTYRMTMSVLGWKLIYTVPGSALFAKSNSAAAQLAGVPVLGHVPAKEYLP